jgi:hypothetical protein
MMRRPPTSSNPLTSLTPLAALALIHATVRYIADDRPIDGIMRPLIAVWFTGLGATYALNWVGHDLGRKLLPIWGVGSMVGFLLDALGILAERPPNDFIQALNWMGVGLGIVLALMSYTMRNARP